MLRIAGVSVLTLATLSLLAAYPRSGSTHEPITTKVLFNKEVVRIFEENCLGCHSPGRIKADIPLTTYDEARPWAKAIKEEILEKRMVPFQAVRGYGQFSHDFGLPQREVDILISWIEGGAPRGDIKDYPQDLKRRLEAQTNEEPVWESGTPDLLIRPAAPLKIEAGGENAAKCIAIPAANDADRSIRGFEFHPGNGEIVRKAEFYIAANGYKAGRTCPQNTGSDIEMLGNWVPGQPPVRLPDDTSFRLPKGSSIILKIDYLKNGEEATDLSRLALYLDKDNSGKAARSLSIKASPLVIPANDGSFRVRITQVIDESTEALAIRPLLFPYAKSLEASAILPNGNIEVLIWVKNYRFDWQPTYYYRKPVELPKGTKIVITAYFDNSESNRNLPTDPATPLKFDGDLVNLTLTENVTSRQASR